MGVARDHARSNCRGDDSSLRSDADALAEMERGFWALMAESDRLATALRRLAAASPGSTNTETADRAFAWVRAVANTALSDLALQTAPPPADATPKASKAGLRKRTKRTLP